jgi:hypothetical protein
MKSRRVSAGDEQPHDDELHEEEEDFLVILKYVVHQRDFTAKSLGPEHPF